MPDEETTTTAPPEEKAPTHFYVRTKRKDTEVHGDLHVITNKAIKIPVGEMRTEYFNRSNIEVSETAKG